MVTREEVWEIAMDAAKYRRPVELTCRGGAKYKGILKHVDYDYMTMILTGRHAAAEVGFVLTDVDDLEVDYV